MIITYLIPAIFVDSSRWDSSSNYFYAFDNAGKEWNSLTRRPRQNRCCQCADQHRSVRHTSSILSEHQSPQAKYRHLQHDHLHATRKAFHSNTSICRTTGSSSKYTYKLPTYPMSRIERWLRISRISKKSEATVAIQKSYFPGHIGGATRHR